MDQVNSILDANGNRYIKAADKITFPYSVYYGVVLLLKRGTFYMLHFFIKAWVTV